MKVNNMKELRERAEEYAREHKKSYEGWTHGEVEKAWIDDDGNICVQYEDGCWCHYRETEAGLEWW